VNAQRSAFVQAVLEGIPLPATRPQLVAYALGEDASIVPDLQQLPDAEFERLDEVGELLTMRPSAPRRVGRSLPMPESGKPPGGGDYLRPFPQDTGTVRHDAPRDNPPMKAIEKASKTQKEQKAEQEGTA
jgi:Protein of unknown function (DUF2795)